MPHQVTPDNARKFALWVVQKLRDAGYDGLWAGGCVRDQLLGIVPSDYDVATSATPDEVRALFGNRVRSNNGEEHGTVLVLPPTYTPPWESISILVPTSLKLEPVSYSVSHRTVPSGEMAHTHVSKPFKLPLSTVPVA